MSLRLRRWAALATGVVLVAVGPAACGTYRPSHAPGSLAETSTRPASDAPGSSGSGARGGDSGGDAAGDDAAGTKPVASKPAAERITYPARGSRRWLTAPAQTGPASGDSGTLLRYRVLVERDIEGVAPGAFATAVATTLGAKEGWTAGGQWRFKRVGPGQSYDFTIYLATPDSRDALCKDVPDGYTSCRSVNKVVLNVARWAKGVPGYGKDLTGYRTYMVNHEVGHRLGHGHERCPGEGEPAPVMQQQTLGLHGCEPNDVPYPGGDSYHGPSGSYPDPTPERDHGRN